MYVFVPVPCKTEQFDADLKCFRRGVWQGRCQLELILQLLAALNKYTDRYKNQQTRRTC